MKSVLSLALGLALMSLASCAMGRSQHLYSWYGYDDVIYNYSKSPTPEAKERLIALYQKIINKPRGYRRAVPPGIYAEYGYLLVKEGKLEEGQRLLRLEVEHYPESSVFVNRILQQLQKP